MDRDLVIYEPGVYIKGGDKWMEVVDEIRRQYQYDWKPTKVFTLKGSFRKRERLLSGLTLPQ